MKHFPPVVLQFFLSVFVFISLQPVSFAESDLVLQDLNDKQVKVSDFKGKWVIVNYWATWCPPCAAEIPELNAFHKKHHLKDAVVLGVNIEKDELDYVKEFVKEFEIVYPILISTNGISSPYGHLQALPTTFVLDKQGKLKTTIIGGVTLDRLENIIREEVGD